MTTEIRCTVALLLAAGIAACARQPAAPAATAASPAAKTAPETAARTITVAPWSLPVDAAQQPDLAVAPDGSVLLSWIEQDGDAQHLRFARWRDGHWTGPQSIANGEGIGNTADMPHVRETPDGALWATWLRRGSGGSARDVVLARSSDDGRTWSTPVAVNTDGTATEHGFAALWPEGRDSIGIAWLDGRATEGHTMQGMDHGERGATMLRGATFDANLARHNERVLDVSTCDCCQTDVVDLDGPTVVYRARRAGNVRDIALLRRSATGWSTPHAVHDDHWSIDACPVNGPAITASGRSTTVAWYTMPASTPLVRVATSADGGANFAPAHELATGTGVLGRLDAAADARGVWLSWLEEQGDGQRLRVARLPTGSATPSSIRDVANVGGRGRGTGWPRMVAAADGAHVVWTDVIGGRPHLRGATLAEK
ncbi:sialidase family protein [Cognatilysobacter terrigena]|uniref:sialidase family protein n=1 Tax=Cognatilysobacter terrigena TaxID=2488749 RepID=UPI00105F1F81|nr:sialidase family protein [Lysobacter terrigena]